MTNALVIISQLCVCFTWFAPKICSIDAAMCWLLHRCVAACSVDNIVFIYIAATHTRTVFARLAGPDSKVYGIDYIEPLVQLSERNIKADDKDLIASGKIKLYTKDGWQGLPDEAPFDAIHVGAAADSVPQELVSASAAQVACFLHLGFDHECDAFITCMLARSYVVMCHCSAGLFAFTEQTIHVNVPYGFLKQVA
eukprot:6899-Heterococcus_DN1.PRE.1